MTLSRRRFAALLAASPALAACGGAGDGGGSLRLGYFPNITHATALIGVDQGLFTEQLAGERLRLETFTFNAGPAAIEALLSGALDATYVGPNPAINAYVKSKGQGVRVLAGAATGGAFFVVQPDIAGAADLRGKKVASPQLGGTQDVALRTWLIGQGMQVDSFGGGDVSVAPQENAQTLEAFRAGELAGAWVPEPWASRLVIEGGGKVLVDEQALAGDYTTTVLLARKDLLDGRPAVVKALLRGHVAANAWIAGNSEAAKQKVNAAIATITGKPIKAEVIDRAWPNLKFTNDPVPRSLATAAGHAVELGLLQPGGMDLAKDLPGLLALAPLNEVLAAQGLPTVAT